MGGVFWKPLLLGPGTFLAGAFYVTKKSDFLIFGSKNKVSGAILERCRAQGPGPGTGPRARDQWTGPRARDQWTGPRARDQGPGPVDRAQGPGPVDRAQGPGPVDRAQGPGPVDRALGPGPGAPSSLVQPVLSGLDISPQDARDAPDQ